MNNEQVFSIIPSFNNHFFIGMQVSLIFLLLFFVYHISPVAGVPPDKMVEAHGTFSTASCVVCEEKYRGSEIKVIFLKIILG